MDFVLCSQLPLLPLPHLRDLCRSLGLHITGNKSTLRNRIASYLQTADGRMRLSDVTKLLGGPTETLVVPGPDEEGSEKTECICRVKDAKAGLLCERCGTMQHDTCIGLAASLKPYECPRCQTEQMDPFEPVLEFLMPPVTVPTCHVGEFSIPFTYPPPIEGRVRDDNTRTCIQLRCLSVDKDGYTHQWPGESTMMLDGRPLFSSIPQHSNQSRKRKDHPLDCSYVLSGSRHTLQISKKREESVYAISVVVAQRLSVEETINRLAAGPKVSVAEGQSRITALLTSSAEVSTSTLRLCLLCPLTHLKPDIPVRGVRCKHLQCFDFQSYVMLQGSSKVNRWRCPVCKSFCGSLVQDEFVRKVVDEARAVDDCEVVEFSEDGSAKLIKSPVTSTCDDSETEKPAEPSLEKRSKTAEKGSLSWEMFAVGCVSQVDVFRSEVYSGIGQTTIARLTSMQPYRLLPVVDPRTPVQAKPAPLRAPKPKGVTGSQSFPIDLDA